MPKNSARAPSSASHIKLIDDWAHHKAGRVLAADADLISALDREGIRYATATATEISLGTVPGH